MKRFLKAVLLGALPFCLCSCGRQELRHVQSVDTAMGTVIQQNIYTAGGDCTDGIMELIRNLEERTLSWRLETSELYRINQAAGSREGIVLTEEMAAVLGRCLELTEASEGAFDVTVGPVARLWDIDGWAAGSRTGEFEPPSQEAVDGALDLCGVSRLRMTAGPDAGGEEGTVRLYAEAGTELDLGAVGKGLALTHILEYLESDPDVTGATVSVGGSVLTYGSRPDRAPWQVGIADPDHSSDNLGILSLEGQWCISTSGDYERFAEAGGVRYHHILDPATGRPADSGLSSVTVLTKDGMLGDALSTACFVLGREKGMELAQRYGAEALFVDKSGEIFMTPGMEPLFRRTP